MKYSLNPKFKVLITILLLTLIALKINNSVFFEYVNTINWKLLIVAFFLSGLGFCVQSLRLKKILEDYSYKTNFKNVLKINLSSLFFGIFLPTNVGGDVVKIGFIMDKNKIGSKTKSVIAVLKDRLIGLFSALTLGFVALLLANDILPETVFNTTLALFFISIFFIISTYKFNLLKRFSKQVNKRLSKNSTYNNVAIEFQTGTSLIPLMAYSIAFYILMIISYYLVALSTNTHIPFSVFFVFVPIVAIASAIPVSFSGLGVREYISIFFFTNFSITHEQAILITLIPFLIKTGYAAIGGVIYSCEKLRISKNVI